jgi:diguanylate cyclase (GGDEF)-like protein
MNILVIDDDTVDRLIITKALKNAGFKQLTVFQVDSIQEGLRITSEQVIDVVMCSYEVALSTGLGVVRVFRIMGQYLTAVIMISQDNDEHYAVQCLEAGAQDFIYKQEISSQRLKRKIQFAMERTKLEKQVRDGQDELRRVAETDSLTGLGNRFYFDETLKGLLVSSQKMSDHFALLLIDIERFKNINESLGHTTGNTLLQEVAVRLRRAVHEDGYLCRLGGDEFVIVMQNVLSPGQIRFRIHTIFEFLNQPFDVKHASINVSISIGIAEYPSSALEASELLQCANVAMYLAKAAGSNQFQYYSKAVHAIMQKKIRLEHDLRFAIKSEQLILYYQPQVDSGSFKLAGVEALIRWQHPEFGL